MRILVTGATGQVGRAISVHLANAGHTVIGLSRHKCQVPSKIEHVCAVMGGAGLVEGITASVRPCEAIVHAAASLSESDPDLAASNCVGAAQTVELAHKWGSRAIVYISSLGVVGRPLLQPITEEHPATPLTAYHTTKLFGEFLMKHACREGLNACSLRITSPCGQGTPKTRIAGAFVKRALANEKLFVLGNGMRRQNYVDVRDVAQAVERALAGNFNGVLNIAGSQTTSNIELARICVSELNSSSDIEVSGVYDPEDETTWDVSISKARNSIGYSPGFSIENSIREIALEYSYPGD